MNAWVLVTGSVLLHFLWQGALLASAAALVLRQMRDGSPAARYGIACMCLVAMLVAPLATAMTLAARLPGNPVTPASLAQAPTAAIDSPSSSVDSRVFQLGVWPRGSVVESALPVIVAVWLAGVLLLLARASGGWYRVRRLHRAALRALSSPYEVVSSRLANALGVRKFVKVVELASISVPTVIGWIRPVIILPVAALLCLTPSQVEGILAHELAHIRRHDYLVNLLQALVETVLFYHPAVWWTTARIRQEREHCCDDLAIQICGDAVDYATALTALETSRSGRPAFAVAATGGSLLTRVRRILHVPIADQPRPSNWVAVLGLAAMFALGTGGLQRSPVVVAQAGNAVAATFTTGWSGPIGAGAVNSEGTIFFSDDLTDVRDMSDDAVLAIERRVRLQLRRVEIRKANGVIARRYFVDGVERPWNGEARDWLASELPFSVRRSGVAASERVQQLAASQGADGVLEEVRRLYTDSVRGKYLSALIAMQQLKAPEMNAALALAANTITSSLEKRRVLMAALDRGPLSLETQGAFLRAAAEIESNAECANVLEAFARKYPLADQATREAFMAALNTVNSDAARARVLITAMSRLP